MYGRMFVLLFISLFTARIVFNTLGVDDYGTYNVVGSIIVFFAFLNNGLNSATTRFIMADIASDNETQGKQTFNVCMQAHLIIAGIVLILAETIGLWLVNSVLNIPPGREFAANVVYQFSIFSSLIGIIQSPFSTAIQAYERMNIYAYFTIFDVIFKLLIIFMVQSIDSDKLILYAFLVFMVGIINALIYASYSLKNFAICKLYWPRNKSLLSSVFSYMSWSILGQAAVVATNQGANTLINVYFNVIANAAMGVSNTITTNINNFVSNFQTAFKPQIVKSYVSQEYEYLKNLMIRTSKASCYLIVLFLIPIYFEIENVLQIWLGDYPQYAPEYCRYTLICLFLEAISAPLWMMIYAQTNIKKYQIVISSVYSLNFFICWIVFALGGIQYSVVVIRAIINVFLLLIRLYFTKVFFTEFPVRRWIIDVVLRAITVILISYSIILYIQQYLNFNSAWTELLSITTLSVFISLLLIAFLGLDTRERQLFSKYLVKKIKH